LVLKIIGLDIPLPTHDFARVIDKGISLYHEIACPPKKRKNKRRRIKIAHFV